MAQPRFAVPGWYATMFSGLYLAMVLLLARADHPRRRLRIPRQTRRGRWRRTWDGSLTVAATCWPAARSASPWATCCAATPSSAQDYTGSFWDLPYAVFTGITLVLICLLHGATFLGLKTTGEMHQRSRQLAHRIAPVTGTAVIGFIIWTHVSASSAFFLNLVELTAILAVIAAVWLVYEHRDGWAFTATTVTIASCIISIFVDLYPT